MAIERPASYDLPHQDENNAIEDWLAGRQFEGQGFDDLESALAKRLSAISISLQDKRPLYFVTRHPHGSVNLNNSINNLVESVAESLAIKLEPELTAYFELNSFDDQTVQRIVGDNRRPLIQPLGVGAGEDPRWWVGPLWIFPTAGPSYAFKRQLAGIQL